MGDEKKDIDKKEKKCYCGIEGCNLDCDPITFEGEKEDGCNEPSCHV